MIKNQFLSFVFLLSQKKPINFPISRFFSSLKIISQVSNGLIKNSQQISCNKSFSSLQSPKAPFSP